LQIGVRRIRALTGEFDLCLFIASFFATPPPPKTEAETAQPLAPSPGDLVFDNANGGITQVATDSKAFMTAINFVLLGGSDLDASVDSMKSDGRLFDVPDGTRATLIRTEDSGSTLGNLVAVMLTSGPHAGKRVMAFEQNVKKGNH
jgi:hypothetical protein